MDPIIQWSEMYSVKVPVIDDQHKELINMLNIMKTAIDKKQDKKAQGYIIQKMMEYSIFHFSTEESLLREHGYPELENHLKEHEEYIRHVNTMNNRFLKDESVSAEILAVLNLWWKKHILGSDKKYSSYLRDKMKG